MAEPRPASTTQSKFYYRAYGVTMASEFELPELRAIPPCTAEVSIRYGEVPEVRTRPNERIFFWETNPGQLRLKIRHIARYLVDQGREIVVQPQGGRDEDVRTFLVNTAFAALLQQRGAFTLHAGCVSTPQGAIAFMGGPGAGKSTLTTAMVQRGYPMLADDVTAITVSPKSLFAAPAIPSVRLCADAAEKLNHPVDSLRPVREDVPKFHLRIDDFCEKPQPLRTLYILTPHNQPDFRIEDCGPRERLANLHEHTYRSKIMRGMLGNVAHFKLANEVAAKVRIARILRPVKPYALDELVELIEADLPQLQDAS